MYSELVQVRARAYEEGFELLMEKDGLIWRQDCSHILAANYTLFVYVHVPLGAVNSRLRLYEYLETPVRIAGQLMVLSPREHMLAVSDDQMRSREVSADYLRGCERRSGTYYCPKKNVLRMDSKNSCLTALYFRRYDQMRTTCPLMVADLSDYAVGVGAKQFIVSSVNGTLVKKMCHGTTEEQVRVEGVYLVNIPSRCMLQTAIADLSPAVDVDADELVQLPLPFEAARFEEGGKVDQAAVMKWATKSGGADGWGPKGPTMAEIMSSWDQSLLEERPMGVVMKILLTITMVLALIFLVVLTICCWRFRREQLAYGVQLTERVRALMQRSTEDTRRTPLPLATISGQASPCLLYTSPSPRD